jgi:hypothetical protein
LQSKAKLGQKNAKPHLKNNKRKRAGGVEVVAYLPRKCKALSSKPIPPKKS